MAFWSDSNCSDVPGVDVVSVRYEGDEYSGSYFVTFYVPDESYDIYVEYLTEGVPILFIEYEYDDPEEENIKRKSVNAIMDWRLLGMTYDAISDDDVEDISLYVLTHILKTIIFNCPSSRGMQAILQVIGVVDSVGKVFNISSIPNLNTLIGYFLFVRNSVNILEENNRYENYKQMYHLRWNGSGLVHY